MKISHALACATLALGLGTALAPMSHADAMTKKDGMMKKDGMKMHKDDMMKKDDMKMHKDGMTKGDATQKEEAPSQ